MSFGIRTGLASGAGVSSREWATHFKPESGEFIIDKSGWFWEAVDTAHNDGAFGRGSVVAIIDSGFDEELLQGLQNARSSKAFPIFTDRVAKFDGHGTVVAYLVQHVAPEAELLLFDVGSANGKFYAEFVAKAVGAAVAEGANVVNMSLQFASAARPRDFVPRPLEWLPSPEDMRRHLDEHLAAVEPYIDQRCPTRCPTCSALDAVPESVTVIAATGQKFASTCPAVSQRAIGVAFEKSAVQEIDGHFASIHVESSTNSIVERHEVVIHEPPGFFGTSFAAPLVAGFAALGGDASDFHQLSRLIKGLTPLLSLQSERLKKLHELSDVDEPLANRVAMYLNFHEAIEAGVDYVKGLMPLDHRHWDEPLDELRPCALCELFARDLYVIEVTDLIESGHFERAVLASERAARICPNSPLIKNNVARAVERLAASRS